MTVKQKWIDKGIHRILKGKGEWFKKEAGGKAVPKLWEKGEIDRLKTVIGEQGSTIEALKDANRQKDELVSSFMSDTVDLKKELADCRSMVHKFYMSLQELSEKVE